MKEGSEKWYMLYDSHYMKFLMWQTYEDSKKMNGCRGARNDNVQTTIT